MRDPQPHVGVRVGRPGDVLELVVLQVRVVDAGEGEPEVADHEGVAAVGEVAPARGGQSGAEVVVGQRGLVMCRLPLSGSR